MTRAVAIAIGLAWWSGAASAQVPSPPSPTPADRAAILKALSRPSHTRMAPAREGGDLAGSPTAFSVADSVNVPVTFLLVPNEDSRATVANRHTLASGQSEVFDCGQPTCYVRYAAEGQVQSRQVVRQQVYRFLILNGHYGLYRIAAPQ